jgi:hypothetical protein
MTTYIVTFEVNDIDRKKSLEDKLQQFIDYRSIHGNCWAIVSDKEPIDIYNYLSTELTLPDRIFIIRSGRASVWNSFDNETAQWLKERL